jgi:hypothetical protein
LKNQFPGEKRRLDLRQDGLADRLSVAEGKTVPDGTEIIR